jgi:hypothetical protein
LSLVVFVPPTQHTQLTPRDFATGPVFESGIAPLEEKEDDRPPARRRILIPQLDDLSASSGRYSRGRNIPIVTPSPGLQPIGELNSGHRSSGNDNRQSVRSLARQIEKALQQQKQEKARRRQKQKEELQKSRAETQLVVADSRARLQDVASLTQSFKKAATYTPKKRKN